MQPKTNQKLLVRSVVFLFTLAVLFYGYQWIRGRAADIDMGSSDTRGWIAAVEYLPGGNQAVAIKSDGSVVRAPGYTKGSDRDVVWRPDGNRIFFSSNREDEAYNIYRWNLSSNSVQRRTIGKIPKFDPSFPVGLSSEDNLSPLMVYGGMAWELDPSNGQGTQVFPVRPENSKNEHKDLSDPSVAENSGGFGSAANSRARQALYFGSKGWVAVIQKTDDGDRLEVQKLGEKDRPQVVAAGDRIFIDVDPKSGRLYFAVLGFQWPDPNNVPDAFIKNGVATKPFRHYIWFFDPAKGKLDGAPIVASQTDTACFSQIAMAPDGSSLAVTVGPYKGNGDFETRAIVRAPAEAAAAARSYKIFPPGPQSADFMISGLNWNPTGHQIAFAESGKGERTIAVVDDDGRNYKELTKGQGNFGAPKFSPQALTVIAR